VIVPSFVVVLCTVTDEKLSLMLNRSLSDGTGCLGTRGCTGSGSTMEYQRRSHTTSSHSQVSAVVGIINHFFSIVDFLGETKGLVGV
jgi:hypothetical protein